MGGLVEWAWGGMGGMLFPIERMGVRTWAWGTSPHGVSCSVALWAKLRNISGWNSSSSVRVLMLCWAALSPTTGSPSESPTPSPSASPSDSPSGVPASFSVAFCRCRSGLVSACCLGVCYLLATLSRMSILRNYHFPLFFFQVCLNVTANPPNRYGQAFAG